MEKVPYGKLKGFMDEHGIKNKDMAELLGITEVSFSAKINQKNQDFTVEQIRTICNTYKLNANKFFWFKSCEIGTK